MNLPHTNHATASAIPARTRCEIYTRVMGYYRPVSQFNEGKKSEFYSRECFNEHISANSKFLAEFGGEASA